MNCINCKKEVSDASKYCVYCGEKLNDNNTSDVEFNYSVDNSKAYSDIGYQYGKLSTFIRKHKIPSIIGAIVILAVIIGLCVFNYLQGQPLSKDGLKNVLIGKTIYIDGESHKIKASELKSFVVTSRRSVRKERDDVKTSVSLNLNNAEVVADVRYNLYYDNQKGKWIFSGIENSGIKKVEPKVDLKNNIKTLLNKARLEYNYDSIDLSKGLLKDVKNVKVDGNGLERSVSAKLTLSNGVVESTVSTKFNAHFDLEKGKWALDTEYLSSEIVDKEKVLNNISDDDKKKFVLTAFDNSKTYNYKYKSGEYDRTEFISIKKDSISDLKINSFMEYDGKIRAEVSGQASSGDISKITFSGVVNLDLSLKESSDSQNSINIDSIEIANVSIDKLKKDLLKYELNSKTITVGMADTFNLGTENSNSEMFYKVYEGTITIDGASKKVKTTVELKYNYDNNKYEWTLYDIQLIDK